MRYYGVNDFWMKDRFVCNSLISTPTNCTGNRREPFLFVFNSFASLCRKLVAVFVWRGGNIIGNFAFNLVIIQM